MGLEDGTGVRREGDGRTLGMSKVRGQVSTNEVGGREGGFSGICTALLSCRLIKGVQIVV